MNQLSVLNGKFSYLHKQCDSQGGSVPAGYTSWENYISTNKNRGIDWRSMMFSKYPEPSGQLSNKLKSINTSQI